MLFLSMLQYAWVAVRPLVLARAAALGRPALLAVITLLSVCAQAARAEEAPVADAPLIASGELGDRFGFHGQSTWVWQAKPAFNAPYSGDNSLTPGRATSYSFSTTLDLGMRLWKGGEFHFNPEVVMGKAFSDLHGLGGPTNGELAKVTGTDPTLYRARVFMRQTWGLGGDTEKVDADFNQFADVVDKRRVVLTVGNLPVLDVFDAVEHAHDPRTQFLNWSFMTHPSFDYPADARGYSWGVALEYIDSELGWAVRAGRFLQPVESNGLPLDTRFLKHYGDMLELEKSYTLFGQEGKVRLLGWRNLARMGRFDDAIALGQATGAAPDLSQVRREHAKVGVGLSFEQKVGENLGLFTRLNWSDDKTETYAFTEAGRNVSFGGLLNRSPATATPLPLSDCRAPTGNRRVAPPPNNKSEVAMTQLTPGIDTPIRHAALDSAHVGDIRGALGTIAHHDTGARDSWRARLRTLLAILGPGLIVMVGDNDAGAFGTYTQAGQNYGTTLLWTLLLLIPVLYVNQEMVLRLGAVTRVGHARLIFARFGKFWGTFSVIDLFLVNALTLVTEFIGISLALEYLGIPRHWGVCAAAALVMLAASTGDFRRFERFALILVAGSLTLIPIFVMVHPPMGQVARDFFVPALPAGVPLAEVMLLIIAIVGTTVAPWQLFFQQSYVIDKRITARFIRYERADLWLGIVLVIAGAVAMIAFSAQAFHGTPEVGNYTDALGTAKGLEAHSGRWAGVLFAIALLDASIIGACAVSLSTAYAIGDVFAVRHSLHRKPTEAKGFYAIYFGLTLLAAGLVLTPGVPLGLLTNAVQSLAGVLLPSATVFLLLLCNDKAVLGPWTNGRAMNIFTGGVVAVLVMLSVILTAAVLFPGIGEFEIGAILIGGSLIAIVMSLVLWHIERRSHRPQHPLRVSVLDRDHWTMPPLEQLTPARWTPLKRTWMFVLRGYLVVAAGLVLVRIAGLLTG